MTDPRVHRLLEQLPEQQRTDLRLSYWSGRSQAQIAAQLNIPMSMFRARTRAALSQLADLLEANERN